jgi:hypothetical protein
MRAGRWRDQQKGAGCLFGCQISSGARPVENSEKLGTSQDFLLSVTFWASGGGASFAF